MNEPQTRPALHTFTFAVNAQAPADAKQPLRFEGIAYSGGVVPQYGWLGDVAIDLSAMKNPDGDTLPVLTDHDGRIERIAGQGSIFRATAEDGTLQLRIAGEITDLTPAGQQIAALLKAGYPLQMSVGMSADFREVSDPVLINGQPLRVAGVFERPFIREVSFVAVGADPQTQAQALSAFSTPAKEPSPMSRTAEDEALIAGLNEQVKSLQAELNRVRQERRAEQLSALFAAIGRDAPDEEAARPYLEMSDAAFAAFAADLKAVAQAARPQPNPALFASQALSRAASQPDRSIDWDEVYRFALKNV
ncbi:hypothetical protein [Thiomonas sp.]|jgi:phage head maturation protease|uniref:hypothetical protein n=1 Tax=Thiomonas sp. TaxID=2047785 RepID=UPI002603BFA6|nr:hypothetical protein [Thiomonas sp.]